jgi:DNA invertase Pin-like site-specific DNA recombinase
LGSGAINNSTKTQKDAAFNLAERMGMKCVIHNEGGKSSAKDDLNNRPVMLELLRLMDTGVVKNLYVWNTDRLSRNQITWYSIRQKMVKNNVVLFTNQGKYDITDGLENLLLGILSEVSTYDNLIRAERSRLGKIEKVQKNYWRGGDCPYGYKLENDGAGNKLVVCSYESSWVRFIYTEYINGTTCKEIKKSLEDNNVLTRRGNKNWSLGSIQLILRNNTYLGVDQYRDKKTGLLINNKIPQIIPNNLFEDALNKRKKTLARKGQNNRHKHFFLLRELLVCGSCGTQMGCKKTKEEAYRYYCPIPERRFNRSYLDSTKCDASKVLDANVTDLEIWNLVKNILANTAAIKEALKEGNSLEQVDRTEIATHIKLYEAEIEKLKIELKNLEAGLIELETDKLLLKHSDNVYLGIRKNVIRKIDETKIGIEIKENELYKLGKSDTWVRKIEKLSSIIKDANSESKIDQRVVLKNITKQILVTYNKDEKYHTLKVDLSVPLIMDAWRAPAARRPPLWGVEHNWKDLERKPKSGLAYSTVTDLAKFLGLSTSIPL